MLKMYWNENFEDSQRPSIATEMPVLTDFIVLGLFFFFFGLNYLFTSNLSCTLHCLVGLVVKVPTSTAADRGHTCGYTARHLVFLGQHWDWFTQCQYTVTKSESMHALQLLSQCGSTYNWADPSLRCASLLLAHGTLINRPTNMYTLRFTHTLWNVVLFIGTLPATFIDVWLSNTRCQPVRWKFIWRHPMSICFSSG